MASKITHVLAVLVVIGLCELSAAQQAGVSQPSTGGDSASRGTTALASIRGRDRQHVLAREKWQMAGRRFPGANAAALRGHAIQQKLRMLQPRSMTASIGVGTSWTSLGPQPLPSDASGSGIQDYSWVSGRTTAVAIDPNDASGNTVLCRRRVWSSLEIDQRRASEHKSLRCHVDLLDR